MNLIAACFLVFLSEEEVSISSQFLVLSLFLLSFPLFPLLFLYSRISFPLSLPSISFLSFLSSLLLSSLLSSTLLSPFFYSPLSFLLLSPLLSSTLPSPLFYSPFFGCLCSFGTGVLGSRLRSRRIVSLVLHSKHAWLEGSFQYKHSLQIETTNCYVE